MPLSDGSSDPPGDLGNSDFGQSGTGLGDSNLGCCGGVDGSPAGGLGGSGGADEGSSFGSSSASVGC